MIRVLTAVLATSLLLAARPGGAAPLHFGLSKSAPAEGAMVASPSEIRLWFTEEPAEGTTMIRLLEAEDTGVHVTDPVQDPEDPHSFTVTVHGELASGSYTVSWRGMGADGHVVRDSFTFTIANP